MRPRQPFGFLISFALLPLSVLSACVSVRQEARPPVQGKADVLMLARVQAVAFPLLLASADWCPFDQEPTYGFVLQDQPVPPVEDGTEAGKDIVVTQVYDRSPAAMAGLQMGDQIVEVNARDVSKDSALAASNLVRRLTLARVQPLQLDVLRSGRSLRIYLNAVSSCQFTLSLLRADVVNAMSNGRQIVVTTGLMRFVRSDDELAWVLAHEVAHNVLGHVPEARLRVMLNAWLGATVGETAVPAPPTRSLEADADYVGAYFMARAGYDLHAVRHFWQRLGQVELQQTVTTQGLERSHPATQERIDAFEVTLKELDGKRARREALDPVIGPR